MARVNFVKSARKDNPDYDIKKGDSYYWWKFRFGGKRVSKTKPRRSQLTQSEFLSQVYDLEDEIGEAGPADLDELRSLVEDWVNRIRDIGSECEEKLNNMPDSLQQGPTGEQLQSRIDGMEEWASELEGLDLEPDEGEEGFDADAYLDERLQEIQGFQPSYD